MHSSGEVINSRSIDLSFPIFDSYSEGHVVRSFDSLHVVVRE